MNNNAQNLKGLYDTLAEIKSNDYVVERLEIAISAQQNDTPDNQIQLETHKELLEHYKTK